MNSFDWPICVYCQKERERVSHEVVCIWAATGGKKKKEGPPGCAACEGLEFSHASHQRANQPDHHHGGDDAHYHFHDFFHFQVSNCSHLTVTNYEVL